MGAATELHVLGFREVIAQNLVATGADKSVVGVGIQNQDEVRETVHQAVSEFLLLVKLAFDLAAGSDIHQRALVADDFPGGITNGGGGIQASDESAVLAQQGDLAAFEQRLAVNFFANQVSEGIIGKNFANFFGQQFGLGVVPEQADQSRIGVDDLVFRRDDVDAFLKSFEKFGKTGLVAAGCSNVACEDGHPVDLVAAHHGVTDTIAVFNGFPAL